jgi:hypothetical protein
MNDAERRATPALRERLHHELIQRAALVLVVWHGADASRLGHDHDLRIDVQDGAAW